MVNFCTSLKSFKKVYYNNKLEAFKFLKRLSFFFFLKISFPFFVTKIFFGSTGNFFGFFLLLKLNDNYSLKIKVKKKNLHIKFKKKKQNNNYSRMFFVFLIDNIFLNILPVVILQSFHEK